MSKKDMKLPETYVSFCTLAHTFTCKRIWYSSDGLLVFNLGGKRWSYYKQDSLGIAGCVGGYNLEAKYLAHPLAELSFWSTEDAIRFCDWHYENKNSELKKAKEIAKKHGYKLVKQ